MKNITTGVDKLVVLLETHKKITLEEAAKALNVGTEVVQEWAELLESDGMLKISYKLSKVWLEAKKVTPKDAIKTAKEISSEKDAFDRKIEAAIKVLETETSGFETIKKEFQDIQGKIKGEIDIVKKELEELEKYETLRTGLDKEIEAQKKSYEQLSKKISEEIDEYTKEYNDLSLELDKEVKKAEQANQAITQLKKQKEQVEKTLQEAMQQLKQVGTSLDSEISKLKNTESTITQLRKSADNVKVRIEQKKQAEIKSISDKLAKETSGIIQKNDELLKQAKQKIQNIKDYAESGKRIYSDFNGVLIKRVKTEKLMEEIDKEKKQLVESMQNLRKNITKFELISKTESTKKQIDSIEKQIEDMEKKKSTLVSKINGLIDFIRN